MHRFSAQAEMSRDVRACISCSACTSCPVSPSHLLLHSCRLPFWSDVKQLGKGQKDLRFLREISKSSVASTSKM